MTLSKLLAAGLLPILLSAAGAAVAQGRIGQEDLDRAARAIAHGEAVIGAEALADRIVAGRDDYLLLDLRPTEVYARGHIDTARQMSPAALIGPEGRERLRTGRSVILYSDRGHVSAQMVGLLRLVGIEALSLEGGYAAWERYVAGPVGEPSSPEEARAMAKQQAVACYLRGEYVPAAGLPVRAAQGGYTPALEPAGGPGADADPLGLGLGLEPEEDAGDGLGLGLGLDEPGAGGTLNIGEGC